MGNAHAMKPMPSPAEVVVPTTSASRSSNSSNGRGGQGFDTESLASTIVMKKYKQLLSVGNNHAQKPLPPLVSSPPEPEQDPDDLNPDELAFAVLEKVEGLPELDIALAKDDFTENTEPTYEMSEASGRLSCSTDRYSKSSSSKNMNGSSRNNKARQSKNKQKQHGDVSSCLQQEIVSHISKMDSRQVLRKLEQMAKTDDHAKQLLVAVRRSPDCALLNLN